MVQAKSASNSKEKSPRTEEPIRRNSLARRMSKEQETVELIKWLQSLPASQRQAYIDTENMNDQI